MKAIEKIEGIAVADQQAERKVIAVDGVFLAVGWRTNTKMLHLAC